MSTAHTHHRHRGGCQLLTLTTEIQRMSAAHTHHRNTEDVSCSHSPQKYRGCQLLTLTTEIQRMSAAHTHHRNTEDVSCSHSPQKYRGCQLLTHTTEIQRMSAAHTHHRNTEEDVRCSHTTVRHREGCPLLTHNRQTFIRRGHWKPAAFDYFSGFSVQRPNVKSGFDTGSQSSFLLPFDSSNPSTAL